MEARGGYFGTSVTEVRGVEGGIVTAICELACPGISSKTIAREVRVARRDVARSFRRILTPRLTPTRVDSGGFYGTGRRQIGEFPKENERAASSGHRPVELLICGLGVRF